MKLMQFESEHDNTNKMTCAPGEDSDQPGHPAMQSDQCFRSALYG